MPYTDASLEQSFERLRLVQERAEREKFYSKQDLDKRRNAVFQSLYEFYSKYVTEREGFPYKPDSRVRDRWLSDLWKQEPHISGVINSVVAIDKNRTWTLTGTRRQVALYNNILRLADDGLGWRDFCSVAAENYYTSDMGTVVELGRATRLGPMRAIYNVDPTKVRLTGDRNYPLQYFTNKRSSVEWSWMDFFRFCSMPSPRDEFNRLGFCALSRGIELVFLLMSVYEYDQERLLARAPKGLLLLQNISEDQWNMALQARTEKMDSLGNKYFGGVVVLAQEGMDQMDAKLIGLSQLPDGFDREVVTNQIMYGFSMIFGYSPDEFWPVQYGALGRARETEVHHMRAATKGGSEFALSLQDKMQRELPETLVFEFGKRDNDLNLLETQVVTAWSEIAQKLYTDPNYRGIENQAVNPILTKEEVRTLLVTKGVINADITEVIEDTVATAEGITRNRTVQRALQEQYRQDGRLQQASEYFPSEPIVRTHWPTGKTELVFERADDIFARMLWAGVEVTVVPKFRQLKGTENGQEEPTTEDQGDIGATDDVQLLPDGLRDGNGDPG